MKLIIGLGNPGKQYENTRHNVGFLLLDEIQKELSFPEFELNKKFNAKISEKTIAEEKVILIKPETFMNLSGQSVQAIMTFYKIPVENLVVIHDDLDIELGAFKVSADSSSGGHNGVQSIFDTLGTQKIKRIRIGIEGATKKASRIIPGDVFVLQDFSNEELTSTKELTDQIIKSI